MTQWGLDTLFNPAKRHMDEEKRRLQSTREEIGDSSGGKRIDLESGKVSIARTKSDDPSETEADAEPAAGGADADKRDADKRDADKRDAMAPDQRPDESPARARARARRARR